MNRLYNRKPTSNLQNFRDILEGFPAISSPISVQLEQSIQAFCDRAIESQDLSSMHDDMKALLQKEYQVRKVKLMVGRAYSDLIFIKFSSILIAFGKCGPSCHSACHGNKSSFDRSIVSDI